MRGLGLAFTGALARFGGSSPGSIRGMQGAARLQDSAGGYVLAAVVSFAAVCTLTLTYVRLHQRAACRKALKQDEVEENQP
ncbi:MAG: hypothetical protein PT965_04270 [Clostridia bacterium]|nr:hypothetical protein [Clostridia bacterium]